MRIRTTDASLSHSLSLCPLAFNKLFYEEGRRCYQKKISKTRVNVFSFFSSFASLRGFPRWEKSKRELIPKPSLEVPCPFQHD